MTAVHIKFHVTEDQVKHVYNAAQELSKAGIAFDTARTCELDDGRYIVDWIWDWSLEGPVKVTECPETKDQS